MAIDFRAVHPNPSTVRLIQAAKQVKKCALAATGWTAEGNRLALDGLKVNALQDFDRPLVIALPHAFRSKDAPPAFMCLYSRAHSNRSASTARIRIA